MWLTRFALKNPTVATLFFLAVALFGLIGYFSMGRNIIPNVTFPAVAVVANYPGASPDEMERLVVKPIEDQLQGLAHLDRVTATAEEGAAVIGVRFKLGTDVNFAATDVQQAVDAARVNMPSDLVTPIVEKEDPSVQPIILEAVTSKTLSPVDLSNRITLDIVPALKGVKGVGSVVVAGQFDRQITVEPDLARLGTVGATLSDVNSSLAAGNVSMPGGRVDLPYQEATVGVRADLTNATQIGHLPLVVPGGGSQGPLHIGDVARVVDGYADHRIISKVNGVTANVLNIARDASSDTAQTTAGARAEFKVLAAKYPDVDFRELNADVTFMQDSINGVLSNLLEGILLTAVVLLFFLHVWRSALVVMVAIPTSLLATFFLAWVLGFTVDVLSLMGLSLTIGILVDDSIVVLENITRHREMGKNPDEAAVTGRSEIGGAAVAITLVDVVVFAPIAFMSGIIGQYMREFGLVVVVATLFSLLVSFTLTPLLAAHWALVRKPRPPQGVFKWFADFFERLRISYHDGWLPWALRHPYLVFFGSLGIFGGTLVAVVVLMAIGSPLFPAEFQPYTEWGYVEATVTYKPGTPIGVTEAAVERLSNAAMHMQGVTDVSATVGRASNGFSDVIGGHVATVGIVLDPKQRHQEHFIVDRVKHLTYLAPGARITAAGGANVGAPPIAFTLSGPTDQLAVASQKLINVINKIPTATDVTSSETAAGPRLEIAVDRDRAAQLGVSPEAAALTSRAAVGGVISTKMRLPEGLVDTVVRLPAAQRNDINLLQTVDVRADSGMLVPLSDIATFGWTTEPQFIERQDRERISRVYSDVVAGSASGPIIDAASRALAQPGFLPSGVSVKTEGDTQLLGDAFKNIGLALVTSFLLIYMLLVVLYRSYLTPIVIMWSVPTAMVGAFGILFVANILHVIVPDLRFFTGQTLNLFSMLGLVMLMGLVAKNGILLVDYANTLRARGLELVDAMRESAAIRFRPIVMTTMSMIAGMTPLALGLTEGAEFRKSMGTVIIGGLISSLFLTLFLVPVVYVALVGFFERLAQRRLARRARLIAADTEGETAASS